MDKNLPDKWIRKAFYDALNDIEVDGFTIPVYDSRTSLDTPDHYILITTQSNEVDESIKCEDRWESRCNIEIFTTFSASVSRLLADNIVDRVRELTKDIQLDIESGLSIENSTVNYPNDLTTVTTTANVFRKFINYSFLIK